MKYIFLCDLQHFHQILDFIRDIQKNSNVKGKYYQICVKYGSITQITIKMSLVLYTISASAVVFGQLFDFIQNGEFKRTLIIYYPFADQSSQPFWLNIIMFLVGLLMLACDFVVLVPIDALFFLIFLNFPMTSDIIQKHICELNGGLEGTKITEDAINKRFLEYLEMHKRHNE